MNSTIPENIICRLNNPSQYLGNEVNSIRKDISKIKVKFALVFPDLYTIGMSNLGIHVLYNILNKKENVAAERIYVPGEDYENIIKTEQRGLCSLESHFPFNKFDIAGFSLQYEMSCTNVLHILNLANVPFLSSERGEGHPLIIGGGPCAYNPEPLADFFDLFVIGDGEEVIVELTDRFGALKDNGSTREEIIYELSKIRGIYVPKFFNPEYDKTGFFNHITPLKKGYKFAEKRILSHLNTTDYLSAPVIPYTRIVHDRLTVEIDRGCTQGCRFCQAGYISRPLRERGNNDIIKLIGRSLKNTGYENVSLCSLSAGMHTHIDRLIQTLMYTFEKDKVSISLPSIRPDSIDLSTINQISRVKKTGFTLAPEAGSQRLRDSINKNLSEDEILRSIHTILSNGWDNLKLYFMIGLPGEEMDDIDAIYTLCKKITNDASRHRIRLKNINIAVSCFVPKPNTPFQRCGQATMEELIEKQKILLSRFRRERKMTLKLHDVKLSFIEAVFARGDRKLARSIEKAYSSGCKMDGWKEYFDFNKWRRAFEESGIDPEDYANRSIPDDQSLPWEHIRTGINNNFLRDEYKKAMEGSITEDCRNGKCNNCGSGCPPPKIDSAMEYNPLQIKKKEELQDVSHKYRITYEKKGMARFLSHLEMVNTIYRACKRADIPLEYSKGFHPHPKLSSGLALPVGIESSSELMDISLTSYMATEILIKKLNCELPEGLTVLQAEEISSGKKSIASIAKKVQYMIKIKKEYLGKCQDYEIEEHKKYIDNFLKNDTIMVSKKNKSIDARPLIDHIIYSDSLNGTIGIDMMLKISDSGATISPYRVIEELYRNDTINASCMRISKI